MKASKMKIRRITIGKSQKSLEEETGIGQWKISQIERGLQPQPDEAAKIASALGVEPDHIFPETKFGIPVFAFSADNSGNN